MKKIIMGAILCGFVSNSHADMKPFESIGLFVGGVGIGIVVTVASKFGYGKYTEKNEKCLAAREALTDLKAKMESHSYEGDNVTILLASAQNDLRMLDEVCAVPYLATKECVESKAMLEAYLKGKIAELTEHERLEHRKQVSNELIKQLAMRYEAEFDLAGKGKIRIDQLQRFAFENYGGTNQAPLATYFENMYLDEQSLVAITVDDLSQENLIWYKLALQHLPTMRKFVSAELYEAIQKEQAAERTEKHEEQIRIQEFLLKKKEIETKDAEKEYITHLDKRSEALVKIVEQNTKNSEIQMNRILNILDRLEDQHGGMARQLKHIKTALDESKNANEVHDKAMNTRFDGIVRWMNEFTSWVQTTQPVAQNSYAYAPQPSPYAQYPSAPAEGQ